MIVDSTALPEQAVRDVVASSFQSAGQRCSALRMLYVQDEAAERLLSMLQGAMKELTLGNPWTLSNDIGPVIDAEARARIEAHVAKAAREGRLIARLPDPGGLFCAPAIIRVTGIEDLAEEIFGPVLHVATYAARDLDRVIDAVNATGYGLTFGLHTRIETRMAHVAERVQAGNVYVNRNQIGAVVGSQPFGGEGLSGTGPKAGGPAYLGRLSAAPVGTAADQGGDWVDAAKVAAALTALPAGIAATSAEDLPGPTGELNRLSIHPRGPVLCLGPGAQAAAAQAEAAHAAGCGSVIVAPAPHGPGTRIAGRLHPEDLAAMDAPVAAVLWWGDVDQARAIRRALAARKGPITPLVMAADPAEWLVLERHLCVDVTAAGGDAALLAAGG
jgi:RHH-type proline utilization regulon transcriptional repressor/proline dehydrogenase/delta 1-pyrroline-5-carboxylate dehydrogenase